MKTEQEQIEKMARSMCGYCSTDGKCAVSKNGREPDICANIDTQHCLYKEYAERLIESGYGKVSEYEAKIERLETENDKLHDYAGYLKNQLGQEQAVIVNAIVKYCENPDNWRRLKDCKLFGGKSDDLREFFSEIFVCEEGKPQNIVKMLNAETKELMLSMYSRKMQQAVDEQFLEDAHTAADSVLCELLTLLGYDKVVKIYNTLPKMYS